MQLIFLDTETTGNEPGKDRLCQVCYKIGNDTAVGFFKPPLPVSVKSMSITHITNKMLRDKKPFADSEFKSVLQKHLDNGVLVAHNAKFDKAMLEAEGMTVPRFICTLRVARHLDSGNVIPEYNLQFLRYYLDLEIAGNPHDAEGDVAVLEGVFGRLLDKMKGEGISSDDAVENMIEISARPSLFTQFNFGKYKDKRIDDVVRMDRGYLEWLLQQKKTAGGNDEDWIYTLEHFLSV